MKTTTLERRQELREKLRDTGMLEGHEALEFVRPLQTTFAKPDDPELYLVFGRGHYVVAGMLVK
jgi:hypothetical protein